MEKDQIYIKDLLRQYREGSISDRDRHQLERLALDDPFLFDSIEGYSSSKANVKSDEVLQTIKSRISSPRGRIINMRSISIAAGIAILVGGLFWVNNQWNPINNDNLSQVAVEETIDKETPNEIVDSADLERIKEDGNMNGAILKLQPEMSSNTKEGVSSSVTQKDDSPGNSTGPTYQEQSASNADLVVEKEAEKEIENLEKIDDTNVVEKNQTAKVQTSNAELAEASRDVVKPTEASTRPSENKTTEVAPKVMRKQESSVALDVSFGNNSKLNSSKPNQLLLPNRLIKGLIIDNTGEPLIGANISVPNTEIGASTDIDGSFILEIDTTIKQLQIAYVGYNDLVMQLDTSDSYRLILDENAAALDEVVVMGYAPNSVEPQPYFVLPPNGRSDYKDVIKQKAVSGCNLSGKVRLKFTVTRYGEVTDFEIKNGLSEECNKRAIEIIKSSGRWDNQFNKDKKVRYTISF